MPRWFAAWELSGESGSFFDGVLISTFKTMGTEEDRAVGDGGKTGEIPALSICREDAVQATAAMA